MSNSKIYVGSLSYDVTSEDLETRFKPYGEITDVKLIIDRETNRSKGFAFITYADPQDAQKALEAENGQEFQGRNMRVNIARENGGSRGRGGDRRGRGGRSSGGNQW